MSKYNHLQYMRGIAEKFKAFAHKEGTHEAYATATGLAELEGFAEQSSTYDESCLIAIDPSDWVDDENEMKALYATHSYSYAVLRKCEHGDLTALEDAKAWCENKARQIALRLRADSRRGKDMQQDSMQGQVVYTKIGRLSDFWALMATFTTQETLSGCYNKEEWSE